jgi:methionine synthase II (cobalamin-independent)
MTAGTRQADTLVAPWWMVGAIDATADIVEPPEQVADTLRKALPFLDADKLYKPSTAA